MEVLFDPADNFTMALNNQIDFTPPPWPQGLTRATVEIKGLYIAFMIVHQLTATSFFPQRAQTNTQTYIRWGTSVDV